MFRITERIKIDSLIENTSNVFRNSETNPFVKSTFVCKNCNSINEFTITPFESGFGFLGIYDGETVLSKNEILVNKIATQTSSGMSYLGDLTVNDLPTLYFGIKCTKCANNHIVVFSYGEKQPGLTLLEISGVWKFDFINS